MEHVIVSIYLPAARKAWDVKLPLELNALTAAGMASKALSSLAEDQYLPSHSSFLCWRGSGAMLEADKTIRECGLKNGSHLMLI